MYICKIDIYWLCIFWCDALHLEKKCPEFDRGADRRGKPPSPQVLDPLSDTLKCTHRSSVRALKDWRGPLLTLLALKAFCHTDTENCQ